VSWIGDDTAGIGIDAFEKMKVTGWIGDEHDRFGLCRRLGLRILRWARETMQPLRMLQMTRREILGCSRDGTDVFSTPTSLPYELFL
jgi:hypothetical protein